MLFIFASQDDFEVAERRLRRAKPDAEGTRFDVLLERALTFYEYREHAHPQRLWRAWDVTGDRA